MKRLAIGVHGLLAVREESVSDMTGVSGPLHGVAGGLPPPLISCSRSTSFTRCNWVEMANAQRAKEGDERRI